MKIKFANYENKLYTNFCGELQEITIEKLEWYKFTAGFEVEQVSPYDVGIRLCEVIDFEKERMLRR